MKLTTSEQKRFDGIKVITDKYFPEATGYRLIDTATPSEAIKEIESLATLGRSPKWKHAVSAWVDMINEAPDSFEWALMQGSINIRYLI